MARLARIIVPRLPYHVMHRGNRGRRVFIAENPVAGHVEDWSAWLRAGLDEPLADAVRRDTMMGRPCGDADFLVDLDRRLGRILRPMKTGRKPEAESSVTEDFFDVAHSK